MPNYLYNGKELPELPNWDKETYPYAIVFLNYDRYIFEPFNAGSFYYDEENKALLTHSPHTKSDTYQFDEGDTEWSLRSNAGDCSASHTNNLFYGYCRNYNTPIWTNTDILKEDGSVYLAASDPVPVGVLTARDLYRKINGKPTKLTLYKKLGGKLIPLDEHTKEVKT